MTKVTLQMVISSLYIQAEPAFLAVLTTPVPDEN